MKTHPQGLRILLICMLDDHDVVMGGGTVMSVEEGEFGAKATTLQCSSADHDLRRHLCSHSDDLWSFCEKVQDLSRICNRSLVRSAVFIYSC